VACVLRAGGEYTPEHVARLKEGVEKHLPGARFVCLSDTEVPCERIPLITDWPGWWAKIELMRPDIEGDLLYFDLDTIITGSLQRIASRRGLILLQDFYRKDGLGSGMMHLPACERAPLWRSFAADPGGFMADHARGGDQSFMEAFWLRRAKRWQSEVPGQVVSYKKDVRRRGIPATARVVCFHGQPRPWAVNWLEKRRAFA
jgi:hypothetical protein